MSDQEARESRRLRQATTGLALGSWSPSSWRTCGLCGDEVLCLVDGREGIVAWICERCDLDSPR